MVKRLEKLADNKKEILEHLPRRKIKGLKIEEVQDKLEKLEKTTIEYKELKKDLNELMQQGYVRCFLDEDDNMKRYFLSRGIGAGKRAQKKLFGKSNIIQDTYKLYKRLFGIIFLALGIGLVIYNGASISGAVISFKEGNLNALYLGVVSFVLGIALFMIPSKKKK